MFGQRLTTVVFRSVTINGARCGIESITMGIVTSMAGFLFGYDIGQTSSMLIFQDFVDRFAHHDTEGHKD
ncbi:hypothetical protein CDD81_3519 [Ophiocordyceps australis]|uniref:Major facilitator superfamily (MFS) profile domain-containing protein n=1 Tax=Ophiocordyceps australis TaxID=1399860 RepID=A0A2C5XWC7_9HYPO|nr:hypothetical protein CDD81_3519 [Ophiocordyceps australis]